MSTTPRSSKNKLPLKEVGASLFALAIALAPLTASAEILNRELQVGSRGSDVSAVQTFLAGDTSLYPQGLVTGYFGFLTKAAVSNFQSRNSISPVGRIGPATLPVINYQMAHGMTGGIDVSAPIIMSVHTNSQSTTSTINWTTNDLARGKVYYSTSPIRISNTFDQTGMNFVEPTVTGFLAPTDGLSRTAQTTQITGLTPNTTYFYLVVSLDASNNVSITLPNSFHTTQ